MEIGGVIVVRSAAVGDAILVGRFADTFGLTRTLMVLAAGFWSVGLVVAFGCYFVYPREAEQLRRRMGSRQEMVIHGAE
jgi:hypothetical protein